MAEGQISNGSEAYAWKLVGELRQQLKWLTRSDRDAAQRIVNELNEMYLGWWDGQNPTPAVGDSSWFQPTLEGGEDAARGQAKAQSDHTG